LDVLTRFGNLGVELAGNGEEALQKIEQKHFDLALIDMKMPKMDGFQLVDEITRKKPENRHVLMGENATIDSALEAMRRGPAIFSSSRSTSPRWWYV